MGKLLEFKIVFGGNQQAIFQPGQTISGTVVINLNDSMKMRAVKLNFLGQASVAWSERERRAGRRGRRGRRQRRTRTRRYHASETYFNKTLFLAGEGRFGVIRYIAKATIDKPWKFDHDTAVGFTVINPLNLNMEPTVKNPVESSNEKTFCCWCCASGPLQVEIRLDRSGYVPGEFIFVNGSIQNFSSRDVPSVKAELIQTVTYYAQGRTKVLGRPVASIVKEGCPAKKSTVWNNERLQIPSLPPSKLDYCAIMDLTYNVLLTALPPSGSFGLQTYVPIIIGSIPLNDLSPYNHPSPAATAPSAPLPPPPSVTSAVPSAPPQPQANLSSFQPPPSYAQAYQDNEVASDDEITQLDNFSPQYAYYDWSQSAFSYS